MTEEMVRALSFGEAAEEYDRVRPGYPSELVDDVLAYAGPRHSGGAVDVGAGTGRVTLAFAGRGLPVTAVEPDPRMAEVLAARATGLPVTVHVGQFETFPVVDPFDLLTCGQAWHWVDPATRWDRAVDALRPGGTVALFGNGDRPADPAVIEQMRVAYAAHAPQLWNDAPLRWISQARPGESTMDWDEMVGQPRLVDYTTRLYRWQRTLSAADFVTLLSTTSAHLILDEEVRSALHADLRGRLNGEILFDIDTELHLARRR
jgi:SAM-dependent methyltransferase